MKEVKEAQEVEDGKERLADALEFAFVAYALACELLVLGRTPL